MAGVLTGVAIGFSKGARYWIYPLVRVLGPIPSTAWIPLAMISFPTVVSASTFLIALAVWFPTSVLTASGISSIPNAYFEAAATLGASNRYALWKVGIPAAMPQRNADSGRRPHHQAGQRPGLHVPGPHPLPLVDYL